jgi:hypothetical protein
LSPIISSAMVAAIGNGAAFLAAALPNKLARIAWTVLAQGRGYEARITKPAV